MTPEISPGLVAGAPRKAPTGELDFPSWEPDQVDVCGPVNPPDPNTGIRSGPRTRDRSDLVLYTIEHALVEEQRESSRVLFPSPRCVELVNADRGLLQVDTRELGPIVFEILNHEPREISALVPAGCTAGQEQGSGQQGEQCFHRVEPSCGVMVSR
jgi:hypothetical protein